MKTTFFAVVLGAVLALACGGNSNQANPCVTRGASYLVTFTQVSGNCPAIPSTLVTVNQDGSIPTAASASCTVNMNGCTSDNNCTWSANGFNYTSSSHLTFTADGASASGTATLNVSGNGTSCVGTYSLTYTRQ